MSLMKIFKEMSIYVGMKTISESYYSSAYNTVISL